MANDLEDRLIDINYRVNKFIMETGVPVKDYTYDLFVKDYTRKKRIHVIENTPPIDESFVLGFTVKSKKSVAIFLNSSVYKLRKNFSLCHEISHCIYDLDKNYQTQRFFNIEGKPDFYSESDLELEKLADLSASIIMLPDILLVDLLDSNKSYQTISEELNMSKSAFYNRLLTFLIYRVGLTPMYAESLTKDFCNYGRRQAINRLLSGWGSTIKKQIILDYENCL